MFTYQLSGGFGLSANSKDGLSTNNKDAPEFHSNNKSDSEIYSKITDKSSIAFKASDDIEVKSNSINSQSIDGIIVNAIKVGNIDELRFYLDQGYLADSCVKTGDGSDYVYPLAYFAAKAGQLEIVKLLHERGGLRKNCFNDLLPGDDAMRVAITENKPDIVEYLLEAGISALGTYREYLFEMPYLAKAAQVGSIPIVEALLKHGACVYTAIEAAGRQFNEKLSETDDLSEKNALIKRYSNMVKILLDYSFGLNLNKKKSLSSLSIFSNKEYFGFIFLNNLDVTDFNFIGVSIDGEPITPKILNENKIINADKALTTINDLDRLPKERQEKLLERLNKAMLANGEEFNKDGSVNLIPLCCAAEKGYLDVVKRRLAAGIDPNCMGNQSKRPIELAAGDGRVNVINVLLSHPKFDSRTLSLAIDAAEKSEDPALVKELTAIAFKNINVLDCKGESLLHKAVSAGSVEKVTELLAQGADVNLKNESGWFPLNIALKNCYSRYFENQSDKHIAIYKLLIKCGANPDTAQVKHINHLYRFPTALKEELLSLLNPSRVIEQNIFYNIAKPM